MNKPPLARYVFEDDGMYNNQWRIYEANGRAFADAWTEEAAKEIFDAVNAARDAAIARQPRDGR